MTSSFFFQAEDGIRDKLVTGVQTCALPISRRASTAPCRASPAAGPARRGGAARAAATAWIPPLAFASGWQDGPEQIGRASCRERVERVAGGVLFKQKKSNESIARGAV